MIARNRACLGLLLLACPLASLAGCETATAPAPLGPSGATTMLNLDPGTALFVTPPAVVGASDESVPLVFVSGLLREAMRQSTRFQLLFAADGARGDSSAMRIASHIDPRARRISTTLYQQGGAPVPLASCAISRSWPVTIDKLAARTRQALGEPLQNAAAPCSAIYSDRQLCVELAERGQKALARGDTAAALRDIRRARSHDGGSSYTLMLVATALLSTPNGQREAINIVQEAFRLPHRTSPSTQHRLLRAHLLAAADDTGLLQAGSALQRERPHDLQGHYTAALAHNLRGEVKLALAPLQNLARLWPDNASVQYQLCFAQLGNGEYPAALQSIEAAAPQLPSHVTVRPRALALFHAGKHEELRSFLAELADRTNVKSTVALHEVRRMQISHAILTDRHDEAARLLSEDMAWIRQRPADLDRFSLAVAENGEILARFGKHKEVLQAIQGFQQLGQLPKTFSGALTYLGGLVTISRGERPKAAAASLEQDGRGVWQNMLRAADHRRRGELQDEARVLEKAIGGTSNPLVFASYSRVLRAAGETNKAKQIDDELKRRLVSFRQRRPRDHPLMSPSRALTWAALK